jgi:hypothetical protein
MQPKAFLVKYKTFHNHSSWQSKRYWFLEHESLEFKGHNTWNTLEQLSKTTRR